MALGAVLVGLVASALVVVSILYMVFEPIKGLEILMEYGKKPQFLLDLAMFVIPITALIAIATPAEPITLLNPSKHKQELSFIQSVQESHAWLSDYANRMARPFTLQEYQLIKQKLSSENC